MERLRAPVSDDAGRWRPVDGAGGVAPIYPRSVPAVTSFDVDHAGPLFDLG